MTAPKEIYEARIRNVDVAAAVVTLYGPFVESGKVVRLDLFCALDETTVNKTIALGIETRTGIKTPLKTAAAGAAEYAVYLDTPVIMVENERPYATITTPTANDEVQLIARGLYL